MFTNYIHGAEFVFEECLGECIQRQWLQFWVVTVFHLCPEKPYWPRGSVIGRDEPTDPMLVFNVSSVCKTLHKAVRACIGKVMLCQDTTKGQFFWRGSLEMLQMYHEPLEQLFELSAKLRSVAQNGNKSYWLHYRLILFCARKSVRQLLESWKAATNFTQSTRDRPNHVRVMNNTHSGYKHSPLMWEVLSVPSSNFAEGRDEISNYSSYYHRIHEPWITMDDYD